MLRIHVLPAVEVRVVRVEAVPLALVLKDTRVVPNDVVGKNARVVEGSHLQKDSNKARTTLPTSGVEPRGPTTLYLICRTQGVNLVVLERGVGESLSYPRREVFVWHGEILVCLLNAFGTYYKMDEKDERFVRVANDVPVRCWRDRASYFPAFAIPTALAQAREVRAALKRQNQVTKLTKSTH